MTAEVLRVGTSLVWVFLLALFAKPAWRTATGASGLKSREALMAATWVLAINRLMFAAVAQFDPGDADATALCYVIALIGGLLMAGAGLWARRERG